MSLLLRRRGLRVLEDAPALPYDAEVAYLESTGTQYIDMGIIFDTDDEIDITFTTIHAGFIYGGRNPYSGMTYETSNVFNIRMGGNVVKAISGLSLTTEYTIHLTPSGGTLNGEPFSLSANFGTQYLQQNHFLFTINNTTSSSTWHNPTLGDYAKHRIKAFKVKDKIDLIAVRKDGIGYMYDRISGQLFGNDGTGSFTIGADV